MTKLTENKVRVIKKIVTDPNCKTRLKMIARQFDTSIASVYRIKAGIIFGHINPNQNY